MSDDEKMHTTMRARRDLLERLDKEAAKRGWSRTQLLEQLMAKWLTSQGHKVQLDVLL